ncbi:MAG: FtsX-like permease family protein [Butyrivibrio sp.]|nr:FtsX-like permease family protein [Butyrivibrio sp.]
MNIIAKLTLKHLLENKKRTGVTILGIAMSVALISSILLGIYSMLRFVSDMSVQLSGNTHAAYGFVTKEQVQALQADDRLSLVGIKDINPKISGVRLTNGKEERFAVGNILHGNEDLMKELVVTKYEGTLPTNSLEVAVEDSYLTENGLNLTVGDEISFEQGNRYYKDDVGDVIFYGGSYRSNEKFETISEEKCKITAILHDNRPTSDYDILRGMDADFYPDKEFIDIRVCLKKCDSSAIKQLREITDDYGIKGISLNQECLFGVLAIDNNSSFFALFNLALIALLVVVVTSVILMVNSFGMSLAEKTRYLGMLASVGATGEQKRFSVFLEGFILAIFGIPMGLLIGFAGTKAALAVLGKVIIESGMLEGAEDMRGSIPVAFNIYILAVIIAISALTIFISSIFPAVKASKTMPIDALKQIDVIKVKAKKLKVGPFIRMFWGYEGELAYKNIKRSGIKAFIITTSIAVSVIMFLTVTFFCDSVERANKFEFDLPYQIAVSCSYKEGARLRQELSETEGVDRVFSSAMITYNYTEKTDDPNSTVANREIVNKEFLTSDYSKLDIDTIYLLVVDDADFKALLSRNGLSEEEYFGDELRGVLLNNYFHEKGSKPVFNEGILGHGLFYDGGKMGNPPAVEVSDFVKYDKEDYIFKMVPKGTVAVFVPESVFYARDCEVIPEDKLTYELGVVTENSNKVYDIIFAKLEEGEYHNYTCIDLTDSIKTIKAVAFIIKMPMYGFTVLLTLIVIANIVNTISTGVILRRKEFAMYRSVGMDHGGFRKMIFLETFFYGFKALIIGLPISVILSYLMHCAFDKKLYSFDLDLVTYVLAVVAVFVVISVSMFLGLNKIKDDSIIEALKEDVV